MVPMGQYTHQERGRNRTMVASPSTAEVSITPKKPNANWAAQGLAIPTSAHCQGRRKVQSRVTVWDRGAPANTR